MYLSVFRRGQQRLNNHFHKLTVLVGDVENMSKIPLRLDGCQNNKKILIKHVITLSILFVCRVPSKWYLKRRETGRTSAWKGYSPLFFSLKVSPCSAPMSCPLQVVSDVIHVPIHHSHILQLQYIHKGIFERTFVTRRNNRIVHAHGPTKLFRCCCQSPNRQHQLGRRG